MLSICKNKQTKTRNENRDFFCWIDLFNSVCVYLIEVYVVTPSDRCGPGPELGTDDIRSPLPLPVTWEQQSAEHRPASSGAVILPGPGRP